VSGIKWTALSSIIVTAIQIVQIIVLAYFLSPQDFGLMGMAMIVIGLAQLFSDLGVSAAIICRQDATKQQLSSLYWLNIFTGLAVFCLVWVAIPFFVWFFKDPRLPQLLRTLILFFLIVPFGSQFQILLQKELSFEILASLEITSNVFGLTIAILCVFLGLGFWSLVLAFLASTVLSTLILVYIGWSRFRPSLHFRVSDLNGFIGFGFFQMGERVLNYLSQRIDQILISRFLGAEALGYFNFAFYFVAQPSGRINPIVTKVAFPVFSIIQNDIKKLREGYMRVIRLLTMVNAPLLIGAAVISPIAIHLIFRGKWDQSIGLIQILSFVALSRSIGNPVGSLLLAKGRADLGFKWNVLVLAVSLPVIYVGIVIGKCVGVAISLLTIQIVMNIPAYYYLIRPLIGKCGQEYASAMLQPIFKAAVMGFLIMIVPHFFYITHHLTELIIQIMCGIFVYAFLLWIFDRKMIREIKLMLSSQNKETGSIAD
jgi:O-antigen/teichoic acid export membrane protein